MSKAAYMAAVSRDAYGSVDVPGRSERREGRAWEIASSSNIVKLMLSNRWMSLGVRPGKWSRGSSNAAGEGGEGEGDAG
jgi:hypothetical protein